MLSPLQILGSPPIQRPYYTKLVYFNSLFDKLHFWLAGWKSKLLSLGGRLQLIRSSINSYLSYWFRSMAIPDGIIRRICSFTAIFFFHSGEVKKLHTISWERITLPKEKGGIGLLSASSLNLISKLKLVWKICIGNTQFAKWCKAKYSSLWKPNSPKASPLWKALKNIAVRFREKFIFKIGSGQLTSLLFDPWCHGNSVLELLGHYESGLFSYSEKDKVNSLLRNGTWSLPTRLFGINHSCASLILNTTIHQGEDSICWGQSNNPSLKDFKEAVFQSHPTLGWTKEIWFKGYSINYALYCWLAFKNALKTSDILARRGIGSIKICCFCHNQLETHNHLFFECQFSMKLLRAIIQKGNFFVNAFVLTAGIKLYR